MAWTEEHDEFCLKNRIPPAARLLWRWLINQGKEGHESEPDLQDFNEWVEKNRGQGYAQIYLKKIYKALVDNRIITQVKKFTWRIYRVIVQPLSWLKPPRKKVQNPNSSFTLHPSNAQSVVDEADQQQHTLILNNQATLAEEGVHFEESEKEVLNRPEVEIKVALALYKIRGGAEKIQNPPGFIRYCLRYRYWEQPSNQSQLIAVLGNGKIWDELKR